MAFCTQCGKALEDGSAFCTNCGVALDAEQLAKTMHVRPEPVAEPAQNVATEEVQTPVEEESVQPQQQPQPQPQSQPQPQPQPYNESVRTEKPVSMWAFFGLEFVYKIPVIGLLVAIVMSFAPKKNSIKNYSRATLIWRIIGIIAFVATAIILWNYAMDFIDQLEELSGVRIRNGKQFITALEEITQCNIDIG